MVLACWLSTVHLALSIVCPPDARQSFSELGLAAGDARLHRADGNREYVGDFLVGMLADIEQLERCAINLLERRERLEDGRGVESFDGRSRRVRQAIVPRVERAVGKRHAVAAGLQEFPIQSREQ